MNSSDLAFHERTPVLSGRRTSEPAPRMQNEVTNLERVKRVTQSFDEPQRI